MKMKVFSFENEINLSDDYVHVLQIEETKLFSRIVGCLNDGVNGKTTSENILFIDNDEVMKISNEIMMVLDILNYDFNQKKIQTALYKYIEKEFQIEYEKMQQFSTLLTNLELNVMDVWNELPFEFETKENLGIIEYLKFIGLRILCEDRRGIGERVFALLDVVEFFHVAKLVIFVNLKCFLSSEELKEVYKYALYKKVKLLLLETGTEIAPMDNEKIWFMDSDYDEMVLYNDKQNIYFQDKHADRNFD